MGKHLKRIVLGLLAAAATTLAHAEPFRIVLGNRDMVIAHDVGSRLENEGVVHIWTYYRYAAPKPVADKLFDAILFLSEYDCQHRTFRQKNGIFYLHDETVYDFSAEEWSNWNDVTPETNAESEYKRACGVRPYAWRASFYSLDQLVATWRKWRAGKMLAPPGQPAPARKGRARAAHVKGGA